MLFQVYGDNAVYQWIGWILVRAKRQGVNPWTREVFKGTKDYEQAISRAA